ncbi:replication initiator protein [Blackfly microvirus SF02]|uniref:Replication initiator protein n=1 Tax=Blackfly microvirus SF02 TaxID=2576452 RepID=A0A4P8PKH8_9VIRU|nr:replication initiator protein [Blackfly microvirus SF02]QCQ85028.1 replication initiator protein [Blackfly microvirus SF02]
MNSEAHRVSGKDTGKPTKRTFKSCAAAGASDMACYHPIPARSSSSGPWTLHPELGTEDAKIPCGKCLGCRTDNQTDWVKRCVHEAGNWKYNRFITLTYDDDHLPSELQPKHLTDFWKRLRYECSRDDAILSDRSAPIRYLACGEYGDTTYRPHYHACIFNCAFKDERQYSKTLSESATLAAIWSHGAAKLAPFTPATAGYVAAYITKHGHRTFSDEWGELLEPP